MLLIDGVKYELWTPPNEDDFERVVKKHTQEIFGEQSIYFDRKQKLKSLSGIGSIPDGYTIVLGDSPQWHVVEMELSAHLPHDHVVTQLNKFTLGIRNPSTQNNLVKAIYEYISGDDFLTLRLKKETTCTDIHNFLADLISKQPVITVIIEKKTEELGEALSMFRREYQIEIVEFQTFTRGGVGLAVHAHLFQPIDAFVLPPPPPPPGEGAKKAGEKGRKVTFEELISAGLLKDGQILYFYHTRLFEDERAQVVASKNRLKYEADGQLYPTSRLAEKLSQQHGLPHGNIHKISGRKWGVSGPKYWKTEDGKSLYGLFQQRKTSKGRNR